jgi:lipopolysaccharide biosynthesis glycosyltransferase
MTENSRGIIVGLDMKLEYLLNHFYINLRLHTDLPVTFFDFGMTNLGRQFCEKRGQVISINESLYESTSNEARELKKQAWFKKPIACLNAPYDVNLWIDLDCVVRSPLDSVFDSYDFSKWLYIVNEFKIDFDIPQVKEKDVPIYNSGFFAFRRQSPFIQKWIDLAQKLDKQYLGDQDVLSFELFQHKEKIQLMHPTFNCILKSFEGDMPDFDIDKPLEILPSHDSVYYKAHEARVLHFAGSTKSYMLAMHLFLEKLSQYKGSHVPGLSTV